MGQFLIVMVLAGGFAFVAMLLGVFYLKPKLRRRYERELWRKKHR